MPGLSINISGTLSHPTGHETDQYAAAAGREPLSRGARFKHLLAVVRDGGPKIAHDLTAAPLDQFAVDVIEHVIDTFQHPLALSDVLLQAFEHNVTLHRGLLRVRDSLAHPFACDSHSCLHVSRSQGRGAYSYLENKTRTLHRAPTMGRSNRDQEWVTLGALRRAGFTHARITCSGLGCGRIRVFDLKKLGSRYDDRPIRLLPWVCKCGSRLVRVVGIQAKIVGGRAVIVTHEGYFDDRH